MEKYSILYGTMLISADKKHWLIWAFPGCSLKMFKEAAVGLPWRDSPLSNQLDWCQLWHPAPSLRKASCLFENLAATSHSMRWVAAPILLGRKWLKAPPEWDGMHGWASRPACPPSLPEGRQAVAIMAGGPPLQGETDLMLLVCLRVRGVSCGQRQKAHSREGLWGRGCGHHGALRGGSFGLACWGGGHVTPHHAGPGAEATCVKWN